MSICNAKRFSGTLISTYRQLHSLEIPWHIIQSSFIHKIVIRSPYLVDCEFIERSAFFFATASFGGMIYSGTLITILNHHVSFCMWLEPWPVSSLSTFLKQQKRNSRLNFMSVPVGMFSWLLLFKTIKLTDVAWDPRRVEEFLYQNCLLKSCLIGTSGQMHI